MTDSKTPKEKRKHVKKTDENGQPLRNPMSDEARKRIEENLKADVAELKAKGPRQIVELFVEDFKRIKIARIKPAGNMVQITGENQSGKSSVLDAIMLLLTGTTKTPSVPVRKGRQVATLACDLGDITVERRITADGETKGGQLSIYSRDRRRKYQSAQHLLDALMGIISFDPLEFVRMKPTQQLDTLRQLTGLDLTALDEQIDATYHRRRDRDREAKATRIRVEGMAVPANLPIERPNMDELAAQLREAGTSNAQREQLRAKRDSIEGVAAQALLAAKLQKDHAASLRIEAEAILKRAEAADLKSQTFREEAEAKRVEAAAVEVPEPIDTAPLEQSIRDAGAIIAGIDRREAREEANKELQQMDAEVAELDKEVEELRAKRVDLIAQAKMPVEGLGFGDGEVTLDELPFDQASSAQQIRASVALAMAANPTIRVLRIKDGSLLDKRGMEMLQKMADEHNYQVWIERVGGEIGIVMEDGEVKG